MKDIFIVPSNLKGNASEETLSDPSLKPRRLHNLPVAVFLVFLVCGFFGFVLTSVVQHNTSLFLAFAENSEPSDIEKIEIQKLDSHRREIGEIITISHREGINEFTSTLKTIQQGPQSYRSGRGNFMKIRIWRTQSRVIEFNCYTVESRGKTIFVDAVWVKPGLYSFGNGGVEFKSSDLYEWLVKNGAQMQ
jgi:hypothetical protein